MSRARNVSTVTGMLVALVVLAVVLWWENRDATDSSGGGGTGGDSGAAAAAAEQLAGLQIAPPGSMAGYSREKFPHWSSQGESCDTRELLLQRQGENVTRDSECRATSGRWISPYDGVEITEARKLDIDHVVPLAEAWRSGAAEWTQERRQEFANDLNQLLAVSATTNRAKGDQDPAQWRPPNRDYWCTYAIKWIETKAAYQLTVDQAEHDALVEMLDTCPN
ncbi:MAG TPA: HNH endonuclease family protein [Pseudonocardiaceae bacterium]